jgi:hypothetical protein
MGRALLANFVFIPSLALSSIFDLPRISKPSFARHGPGRDARTFARISNGNQSSLSRSYLSSACWQF